MEDVFERVEDAEMPGQRYPFFVEGFYVVRLVSAEQFRSRKSIDFYVVICEVLQSSVPIVQVGHYYKWMQNMQQDAGPGNVKGFVAAASSMNEETILAVNGMRGKWTEICKRSVWTKKERDKLVFTSQARALATQEQERLGWPIDPLAGALLNLQCTQVTTQKGTPFTRHDWSQHVPVQQTA
jgi:hypothetical protein